MPTLLEAYATIMPATILHYLASVPLLSEAHAHGGVHGML